MQECTYARKTKRYKNGLTLHLPHQNMHRIYKRNTFGQNAVFFHSMLHIQDQPLIYTIYILRFADQREFIAFKVIRKTQMKEGA
jgi:hypothetical protein